MTAVANISLSQHGRLFVVSGPSGVGKDTVLEQLFQQCKGVKRSISATTRPPRPNEAEGVDYYFISHDTFEKGIQAGEFLEYAQYGSNLYGTPLEAVKSQLQQGLDVILKIEVQGALQIKKMLPEARLIFIQPPSFEELERRLRNRQTDDEGRIQERLKIAQEELACQNEYHYLLTNDDLETAVTTLKAILIAERCRNRTETEC